jgi:hypothetical protein
MGSTSNQHCTGRHPNEYGEKFKLVQKNRKEHRYNFILTGLWIAMNLIMSPKIHMLKLYPSM